MAMSKGMKGYMLKQTASQITKKWQKRWFVLHNTSSDGVVRIEYYDDEAGEMAGANKRTVVLRGFGECRQLPGDKSHPYVFELTSQIGNHVFSCESWDEMESWMEGIRAAVEDDRSKSTKKSGMSTVLGTMGPSQPRDALGTPGSMDPPKSNPLDMESEIDTPNEKQDPLSTSSSAQFSVTVKPNKDSKRLALTGTFTLEVTPTHLRLLNLVGTIPITGWAYRELRNFSLGKDCIVIDCGRSSGTGAGTFIFVTKEAKEVVRVIQHYIEKQLAGVRMPPSESVPAKAVNDSPPLKSKCSAEPSPPLKKAYHNYKPVVENDYGTTQDVLGLMISSDTRSVPIDANITEPELKKNTSKDALLSDVDIVEASETPTLIDASKDMTRVAAVFTTGSMVASNPKGYEPAISVGDCSPTTPVAAKGYVPATPGGITGYTPATPEGTTGYTPATPGGTTGYVPATPGGNTSYAPATPGGNTGYVPATPGGNTSYAPATPGGNTGYAPTTPGGTTGYVPATPGGNTSYAPATPGGNTGYAPATPGGYAPTTPGGNTGYAPTTPGGNTGYAPTTPGGNTGYAPTTPGVTTGYAPTTPGGNTGYKPASPFTKTERIGEIYSVTVKQNRAAKMCGLTGSSYNVEITATHFRVLEPNSPIPIMGWTFQELKAFTVEKDSFVIDVGDSPGVIAGKYVFNTIKSKEIFRAIQQGIQQQIWAQKKERQATLERNKQILSRPLPSPQEEGEEDSKGLLDADEGGSLPKPGHDPSLNSNGIYRDSSVGGSSAGSQEDSSSLTDSTADNTPDALDVRAAGSTKTTQTAPITPAQTTTNPRSYVADKVPTALETSSIKSFRASGVPDDRSGQNIVATKIFPVTLKYNRTAKLFGLTGVYNLEVALTFIRLIDQTSLVPVMTWTLAEIQSYNLGKESIEVTIGQASGISAGTYEFKTKSHKEVFRAIEQSIHRLLYEMKTNPPPPPLPPSRPREKLPAQQMVSPSMKEVSSDKPASSSQYEGHKAAAVENVYEGSPLQQQSGSVSNEEKGKQTEENFDSQDKSLHKVQHHADVAGSIVKSSDVLASSGTKPVTDRDIEVCTVTLKQNASAISAGLVGTYNLEITPTEVHLLEINQTVPIVVWTYQEIKSFSKGKNSFTLEVGRRAQAGPGEFVFSTRCSEEVYKVIEYNIAQQLRDESIGHDVRSRIKTQPMPQATASSGVGEARNYHRIDSNSPNGRIPVNVEGVNILPLETFTVTLKQNKSAVSLGLVGTYNLEVTPTEVKLIELNQTEPTVVWAYQEIRAFSKSTNVFTLEVGRKALTGEGEFYFNTKSANELHKVIEYHIERQLCDETIGREVRNRVRAQQPVHHHTEIEFGEEHEISTDVGVAGKYRLIQTDMPQKIPSITKEENAGKYHQLNDSLPNDNSTVIENFWDEIDAKTNPYGEVLHLANLSTTDGSQDIGASSNSTRESAPLLKTQGIGEL